MELQQETKTPDCESAPFLSSEDFSFDASIEVDTGASSSSSSRTVDSGSQTAEPAEEESELSLLSRIFEVKVTKRKLQNLDNHPFLKSCIKNVFSRHVTGPHDSTIEATVGKYSLRYGVAAGLELSNLIGGPKRSKIFQIIKPDTRVLSFFYEANIKSHFTALKGKFLSVFAYNNITYLY